MSIRILRRAGYCLPLLLIGVFPATAAAQFGGSGMTAAGLYSDYSPFYYYNQDHIVERDEAVSPDYTPIIAASAAEQRALQQVFHVLDHKRVQGEFFETPLTQCLDKLHSELGVRIMLDERALADASIATDQVITKRIPGATAGTFLTAMLRDHGLAWVPHAQGIVVTTQEEEEVNPVHRPCIVYPVYDLIRVKDNGRETLDFDSLLDLITSNVAPDSWLEGGGTGDGVINPMPYSASIAVTQTWEVQRKVSHFLTALHTVRRQQGIRGYRIETPSQVTGFANATNDVVKDRDLPRPPRRNRTRWTATPAGGPF